MKIFWRLINCYCPRCGSHDMFQYSAFNFLRFIHMFDSCPKCQFDFHPEPGFYLGAMYISYAITSFAFLFSGLMLTFYFETPLWLTLTILFILAVLLLPYTLRVSRTLWLALNEKY